MSDIIRQHPLKKSLYQYPLRYNKEVFDIYNTKISNPNFENDYIKWKSGINYITNRKIKINGKTHNEIKGNFYISYYHNYSNTYSTLQFVFFENLKNINFQKYLNETYIINKKIDDDNVSINEYNLIIDNIIHEINKLNNWFDYIEFEGKKYGMIHKVKDNIHCENNCNGNMIKQRSYDSRCVKCESGMWNCGMWNSGSDCSYIMNIYLCNKCNYEYHSYDR
jgi:hypothetical protein